MTYDKDMEIIKTSAKVEILEDRFERHLKEVKTQTENLCTKLDSLNSSVNSIHIDLIGKIGEARENQIKDDKATNLKIYTVNATITTFIIGIAEAIRSFFK